MYMILKWVKRQGTVTEDYLTCIKNDDESIRLFTFEEAEDYANKLDPKCDSLRVITIDGTDI